MYRVTDYKHPFDSYCGEEVLVLEEFRSDFPIGSILNYLDIYPIQLPAGYNNKQACYHYVWADLIYKFRIKWKNARNLDDDNHQLSLTTEKGDGFNPKLNIVVDVSLALYKQGCIDSVKEIDENHNC